MKEPSHRIIIRPLITEKSLHEISERNQYPFEVARDATKLEIARAVREVFGVHVLSVRTMTRRGKPRRVRFKRGVTRVWKKAVVTVAPGDSIDFI